MPAAMQVGRVTHYYSHRGVALLALIAPVHKGDTLRIVGHTTNFKRNAESIEIDHKPIADAFLGDDVAIKVTSRVRSGDRLYRIT